MALKLVDIEILIDLIQKAPKHAKVLSFGYPDILTMDKDVASLLGVPVSNILRNNIIDSFEVFNILKAQLTVIDQQNSFGESFDLNYSLKLNHFDKYDIVLDPGTLEHVFNIGMGLENIINALKIGGFIFHINPLNMYNHGYWNLNPITYEEFYKENGFEIVKLEGRRKKGTSFEINTSRFRECFENSMIVCIAKKIEKKPFIVWPIQEKYKNESV